ncbi:MAG: 3-oxoacyl-ACP reductase FabG [Victivallales bacterium]|nr:3-oxoacyl-ACP reductase FabG [Victivallales bacterium]
MGNLNGMAALVTGGSRGIGFAIARRLVAEGARVAIISTNQPGADAAAEKLGAGTRGYACDIAKFEDVQTLVTTILDDFGKIDILVNNAGITRDGLILRMSEGDWDKVLDTNLKGAFNTCKAVVRPMMKARFGRIVNISSVVGLCGNPGQVNYAAAKAGLIGFTKSLAREIASRNITVNAVAPGLVETDMSAALPQEARDALLNGVPLARAGQPDDIAGAVNFLVGPDASYITGHVLCVDGGMCM